MGIIIGSLAAQNWHRQVRQRKLTPAEAFDYVFEKTAAIGREFGFSPMAIDFGVRSLPDTSRSYLDELKARLRENDMIAMVGFGSVAVSNDAEVRAASIAEARRNLEIAAYLGARTSNFACARNGRVTHEGQIKIAIQMLREIGRIAQEYGIRICQENYDHWTSDELIRICRETGLDNVGIQSDTGNWLILGEDPVEATRKCLPYTFHAHVRDYVLENDTYNGVAVGAGLVDFERVLPLLAQAGEKEDIIFSMEVDTDDRDEDQCARDSYTYLKDWLIRSGHTEHLRL
ncbi:MAG TPA: sugar phosphate isomerase/epimerase family protein [Chloroflexota bacterium]|nr:sugar phosphate isomerase/epimerase family protein [Chloroflexota bacterium]